MSTIQKIKAVRDVLKHPDRCRIAREGVYGSIAFCVVKFKDDKISKFGRFVNCRERLFGQFSSGNNKFLIIKITKDRLNHIKLAVQEAEKRLNLKKDYFIRFWRVANKNNCIIYALDLKEFWSSDLTKFSFLTAVIKNAFNKNTSDLDRIVLNQNHFGSFKNAYRFLDGHTDAKRTVERTSYLDWRTSSNWTFKEHYFTSGKSNTFLDTPTKFLVKPKKSTFFKKRKLTNEQAS